MIVIPLAQIKCNGSNIFRKANLWQICIANKGTVMQNLYVPYDGNQNKLLIKYSICK